jgi:hypothetical protein
MNMFGGLDKDKMAQVQQVSAQIHAEMRIMYVENELRLKLIPSSEKSEQFVKKFLPSFAETITGQLQAFFNINGEIIDVGKKD